MNNSQSTIDKVNNLMKGSVTLKLVVVTILMLFLLIPAAMIQSLILEREQLNREASREVSSRWATEQQLMGPILTVPLIYEIVEGNSVKYITRYWNILPETLQMDGNVTPERLKRGIYEMIVYTSSITFSGNFTLDDQPDPQNLKEVQYDQAFLTIGISDLRGIKNRIRLDWNGTELAVKPGSKQPDLIQSGITVYLTDLHDQFDRKMNFTCTIDLQGSNRLSFVPLGNTTDVHLTSSWTAPSFDGNFLPDERHVNDDGFSASWTVLELNRNYPQAWEGSAYQVQMNESAFGVNLILPMDDYQKAYRSAKYAVMTIALTFLIFFLVEVLNRKKIHPFQYALVGLALCLFYILLVSLSEHTQFNVAYAISTLAIVAMIAMYSYSVFHNRKLTLLVVVANTAIFGFMFVTLQLADYALLMGSVGLTIILALTMFFTRNINWYRLHITSDEQKELPIDPD